jgi:hypothetical protein
VLSGISSRGSGVERGVAVHLAVDLEPRRRALQQRQRVAHLDRRRWLLVPKLLCDSSAALGCTPKRIISSAASTVISPVCSASGRS